MKTSFILFVKHCMLMLTKPSAEALAAIGSSFGSSQTRGGPIGMRRFATTFGAFLLWCFAVFASAQAQAQVNGAEFISQSVPTAMTAGQTYSVSVTMKNSGTTTWTAANNYKLGSQNPGDNSNFGLNRVGLTASVAPGAQHTFTFNVTAPTTPGTYNFQWRMLREFVEWFGPTSTNVAVSVTAPQVNGAQFISQSVPTAMTAGQTYSVSVTMKNSGTTTWTSANNYKLGSQNPGDNSNFGLNRVGLTASVAPGAQHTFTFNVTAPTTPGTYNFQWRMLREFVEWFGPTSTNVAVSVTAPQVNGAQFISQSVPTAMTAGQTYSVSVTMKNSGTTTWTAANAYKLGSQNPADNKTWNSTGRVELATSVAPGAQHTFTFNVTASTTAGTHNFQWRMIREFVEWFGPTSTNVAVSVTASAAVPTISVQRTPSPMVAGQNYTVTWSSTNATSASYNCTASGTGFAGSATLAANGSSTAVANAAWVGYPSTCTWTATGAGGSKTFTETMTTVAAPAGETITYFHNDVSGTPMLATDASGNVVWKENYRPYGDKLNKQTASSNNKLWFAGKPYDENTGLSYMGARYYDPMLGRFMGIDPVDFQEDNIHSFNRYAYANNNPYKFIDPDGRHPVLLIPLAVNAVRIAATRLVNFALTRGAQASIVAGEVAAGDALGGASVAAGVGVAAKGAIAVTDDAIKAALQGSEMKSVQGAISRPAVERYVRRLESGDVAPSIKVDGNVIVDGNHRYVAGRLVGKEPGQTTGSLPPSQSGNVQPIQNLKIDKVDWGNH